MAVDRLWQDKIVVSIFVPHILGMFVQILVLFSVKPGANTPLWGSQLLSWLERAKPPHPDQAKLIISVRGSGSIPIRGKGHLPQVKTIKGNPQFSLRQAFSCALCAWLITVFIFQDYRMQVSISPTKAFTGRCSFYVWLNTSLHLLNLQDASSSLPLPKPSLTDVFFIFFFIDLTDHLSPSRTKGSKSQSVHRQAFINSCKLCLNGHMSNLPLPRCAHLNLPTGKLFHWEQV